jgi:hypothetical protein
MFWFFSLGYPICIGLIQALQEKVLYAGLQFGPLARGREMTFEGRRLAISLFAFLLTLQSGQAQERAARVVALGGDITEIVYALGEGARLVGRDTTSSYRNLGPRQRHHQPLRAAPILKPPALPGDIYYSIELPLLQVRRTSR